MASPSPGEKERLDRLIASGLAHGVAMLGKMCGAPWAASAGRIGDREPCLAGYCRSPAPALVECLILFPAPSARSITRAVTRPFQDSMQDISDLERVTVTEVANLLGQSVVGEMADQLDVPIILSPPEIRQGVRSELVSGAFERSSFVAAELELASSALPASCGIVLALSPEVLKRISSVPQ